MKEQSWQSWDSVADMIQEGVLCAGCGVAFDEPREVISYCEDCNPHDKSKVVEKAACPFCNKKVRKVGLRQHIKDAHGVTKNNWKAIIEAVKKEFSVEL